MIAAHTTDGSTSELETATELFRGYLHDQDVAVTAIPPNNSTSAEYMVQELLRVGNASVADYVSKHLFAAHFDVTRRNNNATGIHVNMTAYYNNEAIHGAPLALQTVDNIIFR